MRCPRLDHFVRFNPNGTISRCGHMVAPQEFDTLEEMESSQWLTDVKQKFNNNQWPQECQRCQQTEQENNTSIRTYAIELDKNTTIDNYLQVGGVLDNVCNAACQTCNPECSTLIGKLSKNKLTVDNSEKYWALPQEQIIHLDINGGEPSYSKNYKKILQNLPPNLKTLRVNTNGSSVLYELQEITDQGIEVTVTLSCDGIGSVFEYLRWPIKWNTFYNNLLEYKSMPIKLNLWTTVSRLNQTDLSNIIQFAKEHNIDHGYSYLTDPWEISVKNNNLNNLTGYIQDQDTMRRIKIQDYIQNETLYYTDL